MYIHTFLLHIPHRKAGIRERKKNSLNYRISNIIIISGKGRTVIRAIQLTQEMGFFVSHKKLLSDDLD